MSSGTYWEDLRTASASIPNVDRLRGSRILVTGATGMICSAVVDLLLFLNREFDADITVFVAGRSEADANRRFGGFAADKRFVFVQYDATSNDPAAQSIEVDFIIHGASNANPALYMQHPVETMLANIVGLSAMFDVARAAAAKRVLYVSSSEVYGQKDGTQPYAEQDFGYLDILHQRAGYPSSKRAGESLCVAYGMEYGIDSVIVRPGHIYGPSIRDADNRVSADVTRKALAGEDVVLKSAGAQLRSYCYTLDCASAILTVLLDGDSANAYNISNPHSICTVRELAEAVAHAGGVALRFDVPADATAGVHNLMDNSSLASDKLESLGWKPAFDLQHGVDRMLAVLRESGGRLSL
ncbi:NAD-dependent epimerase/dehydratase family protein [Microbacterium sp. bgisy189]|uniref:NAD-dependent epimerase/dehydratase family protein n=1 Tax=Microbacterium sp. bgisy189 TaxID=3413798 RepID=UPI003EB72192